MPQLVDAYPSGGEQIRYVPSSVADRVVERFADRSVRRFGVGTRIKQRLRNIGVVAAGRPVQRRPAVLAVTAAVVGIGTARDQEADNLGTVRPVPRPVRGDVQQRPAP